VQDPDEAAYREMPVNALQNVPIDYRLPAADIGRLVGRLVAETTSDRIPWKKDPQMEMETRFASMQHDPADLSTMDAIGQLSPLTCPACHGSLWEINDPHVLRYRCHTGHAFAAETLTNQHTERVEDAVYTAIAALEEDIQLSKILEQRFTGRQQGTVAEQFRQKAEKALASATALKELVQR
jgi:two-component system, chemotaxis family, protein-glutamate methylesterase/glutaminase